MIASDLTGATAYPPGHYVSGGVTVNAGAALTVLAGTVIKFATGVPIYVNGTLSATGSQLAPVYFTDYRDDDAGGDTNGDGDASSPEAGWWIGILVEDGGAADLDYCRIHYGGGYHHTPYYRQLGNLYKAGAGASPSAIPVSATAPYHGIILENASAGFTLTENTITNNANYGVYATGTSPGTITGCTFSGNGTDPIGLSAANSGVSVTDDNTYNGAIRIESGAIDSDLTWGNGVAARYYVSGPVTVEYRRRLDRPGRNGDQVRHGRPYLR